MAIGILYESNEWSDYALRDNIVSMGIEADLIDMQEDLDEKRLLSYKMIVSRVFASSVFRGHEKALEQMPSAMELIRENRIPMLNTFEAHYYEISKELSTGTLRKNGFSVPEVYGVFTPSQLLQYAGNKKESDQIKYPCLVKPDCGGRTTYTYILNNYDELCQAAETMPDLRFIAEEFIRPEYGFITRAEVIGGVCRLIVKRSISENGLSAYHLGSLYEIYRDCPEKITRTAVKAMDLLHIEMGSLDIIENSNGFFIIDVNSVSNVSEDNTEMFNFDLMKETAVYISGKY